MTRLERIKAWASPENVLTEDVELLIGVAEAAAMYFADPPMGMDEADMFDMWTKYEDELIDLVGKLEEEIV